jgi:protease I
MAAGRVACILAEGSRTQRFWVPYDRLRKEGFQVAIIGAEAGKELRGKAGKEKVRVEKAIDQVSDDDYQALLIPGGYSPDHLRADRRFVELMRALERSRKLIAAMCHGPQLLMTAGLVKGRTLTAWDDRPRRLEARWRERQGRACREGRQLDHQPEA